MSNEMNDLARMNCNDLQGKASALSQTNILELLATLRGWEQHEGQIRKIFRLTNYFETIAFVNAIAWVSHRQDHHPSLDVGYNTVEVRYSTHDAGGISELDFICAAKLEKLFSP
jgi:4a-hydroxytetrahydrobiopterin dehydratase